MVENGFIHFKRHSVFIIYKKPKLQGQISIVVNSVSLSVFHLNLSIFLLFIWSTNTNPDYYLFVTYLNKKDIYNGLILKTPVMQNLGLFSLETIKSNMTSTQFANLQTSANADNFTFVFPTVPYMSTLQSHIKKTACFVFYAISPTPNPDYCWHTFQNSSKNPAKNPVLITQSQKKEEH